MVLLEKTEEGDGQQDKEAGTTKLEEEGDPGGDRPGSRFRQDFGARCDPNRRRRGRLNGDPGVIGVTRGR